MCGRGSPATLTSTAATLRARLALLHGRNPYELIRETRTNPGHFREYTLDELVTYAHGAGFTVHKAEYCSYWVHQNPRLRWIENKIPSFRQGMSVIIENECPRETRAGSH